MAFVETVFIEGSTGAALDGAPGAAAPANAVQVAGSDGTDLRVIATDSAGQVKTLLENSVPAGANLIGQVEVSDGTNVLGTSSHPVRTDPTGTTVQPISATALPLPANAAQDGTDQTGVAVPTGAAGIRGWLSAIYNILKNSTIGVTGTFWQATQPVSIAATVSSNLAQVAAATVATAASGVQKVGAVGNAGAAVDATLAAGTAPANGVAVLSQFNTTAPAPTNAQTVALQSDSAGAVLVSTEGRKATYRVALDNTVLASGITYILIGSGTKTVRVTKIEIRMTSSAAAASGLIVTQFYSTLPTGGTSVTVAAVTVDPNDGGATAVFKAYSATASGSSSLNYDAFRLTSQGSTTILQSGSNLWQSRYGEGGKYPTLRGTSQGFALSFGAALTATGFFEWTEE